jgi:hypothetical protein
VPFLFSFSLKGAKLSEYTHKGPSEKSLLLLKPFVKSSPPSPLFYHKESVTEKYQFSNCSGKIYLHLGALLQFSIIWSSEMQFCVIYLKTRDSTNPMLYYAHLNWFIVFSGTHMAPNSLSSQRQVFAVSCVKSFSWLVVGLDVHVLLSELEEPLSPLVLGLSWKTIWMWCDNFEPQGARTIKFLRMVRCPVGGKKSSLSISRVSLLFKFSLS